MNNTLSDKDLKELLEDIQATTQDQFGVVGGVVQQAQHSAGVYMSSIFLIPPITDSEEKELLTLKQEREQATKYLRLDKFKSMDVDSRQSLISILEADMLISLLKSAYYPTSPREQDLEKKKGLLFGGHSSFGFSFTTHTAVVQSLNEMSISLDDLKRAHADKVIEDTLAP